MVWMLIKDHNSSAIYHLTEIGFLLIILILSIPPLLQSAFLMLQRNFPLDWDLENKLANDI